MKECLQTERFFAIENLEFSYGDDFSVQYQWQDSDGLPIDISDPGFLFVIKIFDKQGGEVLVEKEGVAIDAVNGIFAFYLSKEEMAQLTVGQYWYIIQTTDPTTQTKILIKGAFIIDWGESIGG